MFFYHTGFFSHSYYTSVVQMVSVFLTHNNNLTALFIWPALSNRLERKAIIEEISGAHTPDQIEELLQHVSKRKHGFLFVKLKANDPSEMFQDSLVQKLRVTKKHGSAMDDAAQHPGPARAGAERDDR